MLFAFEQNLVDKILMTFEPQKREHILRTGQSIRHKLVFSPQAVREADAMMVPSDKLGVLIVAATEQCKYRMCNPDDCKQCQLGKALDEYSIVSRGKDRAWWEVMASLENKKDMDDTVEV